MRLDLFLKVSRIIKRRTVATEACSGGRVSVNGRPQKPAYQVKPGDEIEITFGEKRLKVRVTKIESHVSKDEATEMYEVIGG